MTRIKICGLYRPEDIRYVNEARPDWCGFILHFPKSHRNVTPDQARALRAELAPGIVPVGVFVDQPAEVPAALRELAPGCVIWKTFQVRSAADLRAVHASAADLVLLDNGCGTGETFDWSLAGGVTRPFLLAGGLTPENIPAAVAALHPYGLDLSSGVETEKKKDRHKIEAAVAAARKE